MRLHRLCCSLAFALLFYVVALTPARAVPNITSVTPNSGTIDDKIVIAGTGFTGATAVKFNGVNANFTLISNTKINATVPANVTTGPVTVTAPGGSDASPSNFTIETGIRLTPGAGAPTTKVIIDAVGFHPRHSIDIFIDTGDVALVVSNAKGAASISVTIPSFTQPGPHWITLDERGTNQAAQMIFTVDTDWVQQGFGPDGRGVNPFENTLNTGTVANLVPNWFGDIAHLSNVAPFVVVGGNVFIGDISGDVRAYADGGDLLWHHSTPPGVSFVQSPAELNGRVFFPGDDGNVYAFKTACRSDGHNCNPLWVHSVGTDIPGGIAVWQNRVYVPSADGTIHVLNPATGTEPVPPISIISAGSPITTRPVFDLDGGLYYAAGTQLHLSRNGVQANLAEGDTISRLAVFNNAVYFTTADGFAHRAGISVNSWTVATTGPNCIPAPVIAANSVFVGGCISLAALEPVTGASKWSIATAGPVIGMSYANNVLYACVNTGGGFPFTGITRAYVASSGSLLWSGGPCMEAPVIVNGQVYNANGELVAYGLPSAGPKPNALSQKPDPRKLRANYFLVAQQTPN